MEDQRFEHNQVSINVHIDYAHIELYDYEPIEGRRSRVFYCDVSQKDNHVECEEGPLADRFCAICNDYLWGLMRFSNKMWPLGKWSKQKGFGWHYLSTREEEQDILNELSDRFYEKRIQNRWKEDKHV